MTEQEIADGLSRFSVATVAKKTGLPYFVIRRFIKRAPNKPAEVARYEEIVQTLERFLMDGGK